MKRAALVVVFASAACSQLPSPPPAELVAADSTTPPALLTFAADWSVTQSAHVVSGGRATIHYDVARLPHCRAVYHGFPAWGITAYWSVDGANLFTQPVTQFQGGVVVPVDVTFDVGPGHDLAVWFSASDEFGCSEWDSSYGRNFHFTLDAGPGAVHFRWPSWGVEEFPQLHAGSELLVDYDIRRLSSCRQDYNGLQTWDVTVGYRFDGAAAASASLTTSPTDYQRIQTFARLTAPTGASTVELWFENHDRTGCQTWDSAYGANYRFDLVR